MASIKFRLNAVTENTVSEIQKRILWFPYFVEKRKYYITSKSNLICGEPWQLMISAFLLNINDKMIRFINLVVAETEGLQIALL